MAEPADVTVIIPAWRAAATIARTLASIAAQTVAPRRVVVVDDGSDDSTFETARSQTSLLGAAGIELEVIRQDNAGAGAARNRALAEADGEVCDHRRTHIRLIEECECGMVIQETTVGRP